MTPEQLEHYAADPVAFADEVVTLNEKGRPWRLNRHQRRVLARFFRRGAGGELLFRLLLWSEPKKSGKTFLAAVLVLWWAFMTPHTEIVLCANDLEQNIGRVFKTVVALCRHNPELGASVTIRATDIQVSNGTVITAIASEYRGAAGPRHSLAAFDELWGYQHENAQRLFEELTPPPTEPNAWVLIVSYAGFEGESKLLEEMYRRGLAGTRVDEELECYEADGLFMFWSHTPRQPWQIGPEGERYYAEQRRIVRPTTFARLHRNEWVSPESRFITPELWDSCVDPDHRPLPPSRRRVVVLGVDVATKHDTAAVVGVSWHGDRLLLAMHRIWKPTPAQPLDLGAVEEFLLALCQQYAVASIVADPFQMHGSIMRLQGMGLPIEEFPQSVANTTRMGTALLDRLQQRRLVLYPDAELRQQALNTVAVETPRGFRIAKEKASRKIDAIAALAMACVAALEVPLATPVDTELGPEEYRQVRGALPQLDLLPWPAFIDPDNVVREDYEGQL